MTAAEGTDPQFLVEVTVPDGALDDNRRSGLVQDVTNQVLAAAGVSRRRPGASRMRADP
jgi:hypothetical protein